MKQYKAPNGALRLFNKAFYGKYANWPKSIWFNTLVKGKALKRVQDKARKGQTLNVIFFVLNLGMWKYESLFKLLLKDKRFNPIIIPYPLLWQSSETLKANENAIIKYCNSMNFPYRIEYSIENRTFVSADELDADFVCWSQPYNNCPDFWKVEKFYHRALVFTYPYGLPIGKNSHFNNLLVENVAWKIFHTTDSAKNIFTSNPITHGRNFLWTGSTIYDKLKDRKLSLDNWKQKDLTLKRVIWAPHHTIGDNDDLPFSTFLIICDDMVSLAKEYEGKIQFVFKPHPMLKERLESKWGKRRTTEYYNKWEKMPNTCIQTGDYADLFFSSDAMIHDCAGFTMEYLFTQKPVLFMMKEDSIKDYVSDFSYSCHNQHYKGKSADDIRNFLENLINNIDPMKDSRFDFYNKHLLPPNGNTAAENMFQEFLNILK